MLPVLAEIGRFDDMVFRGLLVPVGIIIAFSGWRSIQKREFTLNRHVPTIRGVGAVVCGLVVLLFGIGCSIASLTSFFL